MRKRSGASKLLPILTLLAIVGLVCFFAYRQYSRMKGDRITVVVAGKDLAAGSKITENSVRSVRAKRTRVPSSTVIKSADIAGRQILKSKKKGDLLFREDFVAPAAKPSSSLAKLVPEGRLLTTLTIQNLTFPPKGLTRGDRLDVLASGKNQSGEKSAMVVVRDAYFVGYLSPPASAETKSRSNNKLLDIDLTKIEQSRKSSQMALLLALPPEDMLPLAAINGSGTHLNLVLHGSEEGQGGDPLRVFQPEPAPSPPPPPPPETVELIIGSQETKVVVVE